MFIAFEGIEGTGKSTQLKRFARHLEERGKDVLCTFEPGGTHVGGAIRKVLLDPENDMDDGTELFLIMASRRQIVQEVIRPALDAGKIVISDRFVHSSFAYQAFGRGLPEEMVSGLAQWACGEIWPDYTVLFDIDPSLGLARSMRLEKADAGAGKGDRIESCGAQFMEKVRQGYLELARRQPDRFVVLPVTGTEEETFEQMIKELDFIF